MVSDERGQLILVGAIAIALVVLGLVLIVNTALFTQVVGSEGTVESAKEGGITGQEVGDAIAVVVAERNTESDDVDVINSQVSSNTDGDLEPALREQQLETSGAFVAIDYYEYEDVGSVVTQTDSNTFTDQNGLETWEPVPSTRRGDVGGFVATVDYGDSTINEEFTVYVEDSAGVTRSVSVTPRSGDVVDIDASSGGGCTDVPVTSGTVRIDFSAGTVYESNTCQFTLFDGLEPGYAVTFENGDAIEGTYTLATERSLDANPHLDNSGPPDQPSETDAIWSFEYAFTYGTSDVTAESESRVIDVYD